ncbi:MAG: molybdopterin-dependent oxidoreductase [Actinobacteria bacterium]|uniref:Unannotated protein n=1 Tax=freshwater metagenome TaxID=449393 RepID=A0A6J7PSN1_9ZZZZ|nr:molybdopterin-dependent oxidoreductase [Actinomycetota bacterium]
MDDPALLVRGASPYVADLSEPDLLHAAFVRSPFAHARILTIDSVEATLQPGVAAVLTAADLALVPVPGFDAFAAGFARAPLAESVVRFAGEPVAIVLASSAAAAVDAASLVDVRYEPMPHVLDPLAALKADAPLLFPALGSNQAFATHLGGSPADALEGADVIIHTRHVIPRVAPVPMEPNGILIVPRGGAITVWASTQGVHTLRDALAATLGLASIDVRVISPAVGGAFGAKYHVHTDLLVVAAAAIHVGRATRWIETRTEHLHGASHGRGQQQDISMGFRHDGTIVGLAATLTADGGAYPGLGAIMPNATAAMACGPYRLRRIAVDARGAVTNTSPTIAYRGAGRPEATAMLEFTIDRAAHRLGIDPIELRLRNVLRPDELPYTTATGVEIDSGDYPAVLALARERIGYDDVRAAQERDRYRPLHERRLITGVGVGLYLDITPFRLVTEFASVTVRPGHDTTGMPEIELRAGTLSHGQNHRATYGAIAERVLHIPRERCRLEDRDTSLVPRGIGSASARSVQIAGSAIHEAAIVVRDRACQVAADLLEARVDDIELTTNGFNVRGAPSSTIAWADVLRATGPIAHEHDWTQSGSTIPFGVHAATVTLDRETGALELMRFVAVDDCGVVVDGTLVDGQQQGGAAQGIATMLYEEIVYDENGNLRTSNFGDYLVPAASDLPRIETARTEVPTPRNPIGAKGIGQSGAIGSPPAIHNAVLDAFAQLGAIPEQLDPPFTPERMWNLLRNGGVAW